MYQLYSHTVEFVFVKLIVTINNCGQIFQRNLVKLAWNKAIWSVIHYIEMLGYYDYAVVIKNLKSRKKVQHKLRTKQRWRSCSSGHRLTSSEYTLRLQLCIFCAPQQDPLVDMLLILWLQLLFVQCDTYATYRRKCK